MTPVLRTGTYWVPKAGNSEAEYEDAFYPEHRGGAGGHALRFAMADGASEGILSGQWAKILVRSFYRVPQRPSRASARVVVSRACDSWEAWKSAYLRRRAEMGRPVQWWEEQGLSTGPFATLLGAAFASREGSKTGRWDAVAMGDTCLFAIRGGRLALSFPILDSSAFGSRPVLLSGDRSRSLSCMNRMREACGSFSRGDSFYLMTDALAAWFLRESEDGGHPWEILEDLDGYEGYEGDEEDRARDGPFLSLVDRLRKSGEIRNDDVTLARIRVV